MSGSRLGRGRGGRLAVYGGCLVVVVLLVFLYRAATTEMTRLRELHIQCSHQQEALAAQLQVIFEYKVRLEKSLAEEKSSNTAIKQELQQRASREKSLRDKDSVEALQKFNSLQQHHKLLQSEHQDLKEEYDKRQKLALEESNRLESTLQDLRGQIREKDKACDESMQHLKNKYLELETDKKKLDDKYNDLIKSTGNSDSRVERLNKEVFQLKRELTKTKASCKTIPSEQTLTNPQSSQQIGQPSSADQQVVPSRQQVSRPSNDNEIPQPLQPPQNHQPIDNPSDNAEENEDEMINEQNNAQENSPVFEMVDGKMVPGDPNKGNRDKGVQKKLPIPYDKKNSNDLIKKSANQGEAPKSGIEMESYIDDQAKQVLPMPNQENPKKTLNEKSSSKSPNSMIPILKPQNVDSKDRPEEQQRNIESPLKDNDIDDTQKQVAAIPPENP